MKSWRGSVGRRERREEEEDGTRKYMHIVLELV